MRQTPIARALAGSLLVLCACSGPEQSTIFDSDGMSATSGPGGIGSTTSTVNTANNSTSDTTTTTTGDESTATSSTSTTGSGGNGTGGSPTTSNGGSDSTSDGGTGGTSDTTASTSGGTGGGGTGGGGTGGSGATGGTGTGGDGGTPCTPTDEVCDGHDNDCNDATDDGDACPVGCMGASFEGHAYMFCNSPTGVNGSGRRARSWQQAMQFCMDHGQLLVRVESESESAFVYQSLNESDGSGDVWMGATDQEDEDQWSWAVSSDPDDWVLFYDADEGTPVDGAFIDWRQGEPNNMGGEDCGVFEDQEDGTWLWDDRSCSTDFERLVCEDPD